MMDEYGYVDGHIHGRSGYGELYCHTASFGTYGIPHRITVERM